MKRKYCRDDDEHGDCLPEGFCNGRFKAALEIMSEEYTCDDFEYNNDDNDENYDYFDFDDYDGDDDYYDCRITITKCYLAEKRGCYRFRLH